MVELTPERIFALNPKIRWVGIANDKGDVLFSKMRAGVESLSPEHEDREFMQLGPMILTRVSERLASWAGGLEAVIVRYAQVMMIIRRFGTIHLALTIDSKDYDYVRATMESLDRIFH